MDKAAIVKHQSQNYGTCLSSDGWSGVQKRKVVNAMVNIKPKPIFLEAVYPGTNKQDARYLADLHYKWIHELGTPTKVIAESRLTMHLFVKPWVI